MFQTIICLYCGIYQVWSHCGNLFVHHCSTYFIKNKGVFAPLMLSDSDFKLCYTIPYTLIINISRGQVPMIYTKVTIFFFKSKRV